MRVTLKSFGSCAGRAKTGRSALLVPPLLCLAAWLAPVLPAAAQAWTLTLLDGEALVVDGTRRLAAVPGLPLSPGALLETGAQTGLMRLEGRGQTTLDLGPDTRVLLLPGTLPGAGGRAPVLYLLQGWVKATAGPGANGQLAGLVSTAVEVLPFQGSAVLQVQGGTHHVFAESGALQLNERRRGGQAQALRAGQFYSADAGRSGVAEPRPPADWLAAVPRAFRDPLPLRAEALRGQPFQARVLPDPTHAQLAPWLEAELYLRRGFTRRFAALAQDAAFRQGLRSRLRAHPEWGVVLDPPPPPVKTPLPPAAPNPAVAPRTPP